MQTSGTGVVRHFNRHSLADGSYARSILRVERGIAPASITTHDIAWAAARGDDQFTQSLLREAALALALLLRNLFTSHPALTVVFVGGFALGVGAPLVSRVQESLKEIGLPFFRKSDLSAYVDSRILLGGIPADDTNLVGARLFLLQEYLET